MFYFHPYPVPSTSNPLSNIIDTEESKMLVPSTANTDAAWDWNPYLHTDVPLAQKIEYMHTSTGKNTFQ